MGQDTSKSPTQPEQTKAKLDPSELALTRKPDDDGSIDEYVEETSEGIMMDVAEVPLTQGKELAEIEKNDPVDEYVDEKSDKKEVSDIQDYAKELQQGTQFKELSSDKDASDDLNLEGDEEALTQ